VDIIDSHIQFWRLTAFRGCQIEIRNFSSLISLIVNCPALSSVFLKLNLTASNLLSIQILIMTSTTTGPYPLTTIFTPSRKCFTHIRSVSSFFGEAQGLILYPLYDCYPSHISFGSYFSPGLCPTGYRTVVQAISQGAAGPETQATCCPRYIL
jgi:hypothetical protein